MKQVRKRYLIVSTVAPEVVCSYNLSVATSNFTFNLAGGGTFDKVYSVLPDTFGGELENTIKEDQRYDVVYCQKLRKCGRLMRIFAALIEQYKLFKRIPSESSVWLYNITDLNFLFFVLMRLFKRKALLNVIVLDYTPPSSLFDRVRLYIKLINIADGIISLSTSNRFNSKNKAILAGVVPLVSFDAPHIIKPNNKFLLSGVLSEVIAQSTLVLSTFAQLPECELHITGFASDDSIYKQFSENYSNIHYHGKVSYDEYLSIMHDCTFVLSTRDESFPENQCNFPSKIIETLLHNRIVISTINYPQLGSLKYFKVNSDQYFLSNIKSIVNTPMDELMKYANQHNSVSEAFSPIVWERKIIEIESVEKIK